MEPVIELTDLSKTYGRGAKAVPAVRGVSLTVHAGEVYGFLGPNGAGKSTTIRMMLSLIAPSGGSVRLFGETVAGDHKALRRVGSLVDGGNFYPFLSGRRNLEVLARTQGHDGARIEGLLEQVGLAKDAGRKVKGYSTGMRQRLGVAAALLNDPDIVILDEPANGLDAEGIREMRLLVRALAEERGKAVFLSSHLLHEVQQLCDRVAIVSKGSLIHESTISDLLRHERGFLVEAEPVETALTALASRWECRAENGAIHVEATRDEMPDVTRRLVGAGIDIFSIVPAARNLEEVFLSMTQGGGDDA